MSSSKNGNGKTTCKEVCSKCKCIVYEKPIKENENKECKEDNNGKKQDCVATIVGVLSLSENFCNGGGKKDDCVSKKDDCDTKMDECDDNKNECVEVYRDLGECLQKCIVKTSKSLNGKGKGKSNAC